MTESARIPWASNAVAQGLLTYLHIAYPIILLFVYLFAFTARSIATARNDNDAETQPEQLGQVQL